MPANRMGAVGKPITAAAPFVDPTDIAGLQGWWDASDASSFTYSSGSSVSTWADLSGNSRTMSVVTAGREPDRTGTINSLAAVDFTPNDAVRSTDPGSQLFTTTWTVFVVIQPDTVAAGNRNVFATGHTNGCTFRIATATPGLFAGTVVAGGTVSAATTYVIQGTLNGASSTLRLNGGSSVISGNPGTQGWRGFGLGAYAGATSENFDGKVGEVVFYDSALSLSQTDDVAGYLASKWGTTWTPAA